MRYYSRIVKKFTAGQVIFSENSECDGMYIIDSGRVRVYKSVDSGSGKQDVELCTLGPKSMFGEMSMIDEDRRSASVQALEPVVCTVITKKIFEDQLSQIPGWMVNMIKILVSRLRETNNKLRAKVEEYTTVPQDPGALLTIDEEDSLEPIEFPDAPSAGKSGGSVPAKDRTKHFRSEEIIEELFDDH